MLILLFVIWLFTVTVHLGLFAVRIGWGIFRILFSVILLPVLILGLMIGGIIQLTVPVLAVIGLITVGKFLIGGKNE